MIAVMAREEFEFTELRTAARLLEAFKRLPGENRTRGHPRLRWDRAEELIAILLGLQDVIVHLGLYYHDLPRLTALTEALDIVLPCLAVARAQRERMSS